MAQTKKKTTTSKKSSSSKGSSSSKKNSRQAASQPPQEPVVPIRREVGAVIFLFLAVFVAISYFKSEGSFIMFLRIC